MAKQLMNLEVDEISLVDNPAAPLARVLLYKRDTPDLVSKCLAAVQREDLEGVTKADFEAALDAMAQDHAEASGLPFLKSYTDVLVSPEGQQLYAGLIALNCKRPL